MQTLAGSDLYTQLGDLLGYPGEDIRSRAEAVSALINCAAQYPDDVRENIAEFVKKVAGMPLDDLQGIYSYTFEMSSDYTLDLGYHIHEGFKRAENLLQIKAMYRHFEFPFEETGKGELTDHLPLVLKFLGFLKDEEARRDLRVNFLIKALEKLNKNFDKNRENPYRPLINAIYRIIDKDIKDIKEEVK